MKYDDAPSTVEAFEAIARRALEERLPSGWSVACAAQNSDGQDLIVTNTSGESAALRIRAAQSVRGADAAGFVSLASSGVPLLIVTRYISKPVQDVLKAGAVSFLDATGNMFVHLSKPALFISDRGADADPWRGAGRPAAGLGGAPAASLVRAVVDVPGPWTARALAEIAGVAVGSVYRVMRYLEDEGLVSRDEQKRFVIQDWVPVLRAWSRDYSFVASNRTSRWLDPRGLDHLMSVMATAQYEKYALTGSLAAHHWVEEAPARLAMVYVGEAHNAAEAWGLTMSEAGANVILAEASYPVVFDRTVNTNGVQLAAPSQTTVDLLTGPGRSPAEAEELISWMEQHEQQWRGQLD